MTEQLLEAPAMSELAAPVDPQLLSQLYNGYYNGPLPPELRQRKYKPRGPPRGGRDPGPDGTGAAGLPYNRHVVVNEYDLAHDCLTIEELRWILRKVGRYSPYYMFFLLRVTCGLRTKELIENVTLYSLKPDCSGFRYKVDKHAPRPNRKGDMIERIKHRDVILDPWVRDELIAYLNTHMRNVNGTYVSPHEFQRLFPFKDTLTVDAYWYKLRLKMKVAGFDSLRKIRDWRRDTPVLREQPIYVVRPHILRHLSCTIYYYRHAKDIVATQQWIKHEDIETTKTYLHTAASIGLTEEQICTLSWPEILGFEKSQRSLSQACAPDQTSLDQF